MLRVAAATRRSSSLRASSRRAIIWLKAVASSPTSSLVRTGTASHGPPGAHAIALARPVTSSIGRVSRREKRMPWASARTRLARNTTTPRCSMVSSSPSKSPRYTTATIRSPPSPSGAKATMRGVYTRSTAIPSAPERIACVTEGRKPSASSRCGPPAPATTVPSRSIR